MIPIWLTGLASKKIPWTWIARTGVLIAAFLVGLWIYNLGRDHERVKYEKQLKEGQAVIEKLKATQGRVTVRTEIRYVDRVKTIKEKARVIEKKIPIYIPVDTPDLPGGFRVLHDSAALGTIPGASEDGVPVSVRTTTETINRNYAICHQWKAALDEQVRWGQEQRKVYLSECKRLKQNCN